MLIKHRRIGRRRENGQILVLSAVVLPVVLLFGAFTIDASNVFLQHQQLQNAADAAAMATAQDLSIDSCSSSCGSDAGTYAGLNGANPGASSSSPLPACSTTAPIVSTNCYVAPYGPNENEVEVLLQKSVPTFFGGVLGIHSLTISVRSVAGLVAGNAPPISFAALDNSCENHTLLVEAGGQLTVDNGIDDDSCSGDENAPYNNGSHDSFDVFSGSSAGNISAPSINVVGGWETHGSTVTVGGQVCGLTNANSNTPASPGCPTVNASPTADPFANKIVSPTVGTAACQFSNSSEAQYTPQNVTMNAAALNGPTPEAYSPNPVTLNAPTAAASSEIAYTPNSVTLNAAVGTGFSTEAYSPNAVTLNAPAGDAAYTNTVTLNAAVVTTPTPQAYSPTAVTLQAAALGAPTTAAYAPQAVTLSAAVASTSTTTVQVTSTPGADEVAVGDVIKIGSEEMLVTAAPGGPSPWALTVTRGFNGTIAATHTTTGVPVTKETDTTVTVTSAEVAVGDTIEIGSEQMVVAAVTPAGPNSTLTVTRGANGTTEVAHSITPTAPAVDKVVLPTTIQVTNAGAVQVAVGDTIQIDNEQMYVSAVTADGAQIWNLTVLRAQNFTTEVGHSITPTAPTVYKVVGSTTIQVTNATASSSVAAGDTIQVDSEQMHVNTVTTGAGPWTLTVTRGYNSTTQAAHATGAAVTKVVGSTTIQVTNTGGVEVAAGDTIEIDSEQMYVNTVSTGAGPWTLTVTRGYNSTAVATHTAGTAVYKVSTTMIQITNTGGVEVAVGDVIRVDNEDMQVTAVSGGAGPWNLTVTRGSNNTTAAAHAAGAAVEKVYLDTTIQVTNTGGVEVAVNDVIQVDNEEMQVTAVSGGKGPWTLTVTRAFNGTLESTHSVGAIVYKVTTTSGGSAAAPSPCNIGSGSITLQPGTYYGGICIGAAGGATSCSGTTPGSNCLSTASDSASAVAFTPAVTLSAAIGTGATSLTVTGAAAIEIGQVIEIDSEEMLVTGVSGSTITVSPGYNSTESPGHSSGATVYDVTIGTAYAPAETLTSAITSSATSFDVNGGNITANSIIGIDDEEMVVQSVSTPTGPNNTQLVTLTSTGRGYNSSNAAVAHAASEPVLEVSPTSVTGPSVTMAAGTYIMAGGGFFVCGDASLSAPNVLIYNTDDSAPGGTTSGNGALGQVDLNTSGSVDLGPQTTGTYAGLTIFQDPNLTLDSTDSCDSKHTNSDEWDIALQSMAPVSPPTSTASGALGSISGTIYAPAYRADFADVVSGTANLAVITSCIFIDGANSTYDYQSSGLFGVTYGLTG